ncbi:MAG: ankyrin repeat domain-containing protein [Gammaproteobacteria bacterium]
MPFPYENHIKQECKELAAAIKNGDLVKVKQLINDQNLQVKIDTGYSNTPLMVAVIHSKPEIVEYLLERKCDINQGYSSYPPLHYVLNTKKIDTKMAVLLIKKGTDISHKKIASVLANLEAGDNLKKLIENLCKYKDARDESKSELENYIGLNYSDLGDTEESIKWLQRSALNGNHYGMWNLYLELYKKKQHEEALTWLLKCIPFFKPEKDKSDIIRNLKEITALESENKESATLSPQAFFDANVALARLYLEKNDPLAIDHFRKANMLSKTYCLKDRDADLQKILIWTDLSTPILKNMADQTQDMPGFITLFLNLAREVKEKNQKELALLLLYIQKTSLGIKATSAYALKHFTPSAVESDQLKAANILTENSDYIEGLKALYGWHRKRNTFEAIKRFEQVVKSSEKDKPIDACYAHLHIIESHCQIASSTTDESIKSERIVRVLKSCEFFKKSYIQLKNSSVPRFELFNQLLRLLNTTNKKENAILLTNTLLEFYQLEVKNFSFSSALLQIVFEVLLKKDVIRQDLTIWNALINTLLSCHEMDKTKNIICITQLEALQRLATDLDPKFKFSIEKALATGYSRYDDKASLQKATQCYEKTTQLAESAEAKFGPELYKDIYKRLAAATKVDSPDEAIKTYKKAAELGDIDASLHAAEIAQQDEKQIELAITSYQQAMVDAIKTDNIEKIIATIKQLCRLKETLDLSSKEDSIINNTILTALEKLNNKTLIQPHIKLLGDIRTLVQNNLPAEMFTQLFAAYDLLHIIESSLKEITAKPKHEIIKSLLLEFAKQVGIQNAPACDAVQACLFEQLSKLINEKPKGYDENIFTSLFLKFSCPKTIELQKNLIKKAEELFLAIEKEHPPVQAMLCNLYLGLYSGKNSALRLKGKERTAVMLKNVAMLKKIYDRTGNSIAKDNLLRKLEEKDTIATQSAQFALDTITYKEDEYKEKEHALASRNFLPSVYDLLKRYHNRTFKLFGARIRRQLYLATKIILITLNKEAAKTRFNLDEKQIAEMTALSTKILQEWQSKNLARLSEKSETYRNAKLANWYGEMIENARMNIPSDPDVYLLNAMNFNLETYDMEQIRHNVQTGMKRSLKINDEWIKKKSTQAITFAVNGQSTAMKSTTHAALKPLSRPIVVSVPSAPPAEHEHTQLATNSLLYPDINEKQAIAESAAQQLAPEAVTVCLVPPSSVALAQKTQPASKNIKVRLSSSIYPSARLASEPDPVIEEQARLPLFSTHASLALSLAPSISSDKLHEVIATPFVYVQPDDQVITDKTASEGEKAPSLTAVQQTLFPVVTEPARTIVDKPAAASETLDDDQPGLVKQKAKKAANKKAAMVLA